MNEWIIIDTDELKRRYAPKLITDEMRDVTDMNNWMPTTSDTRFAPGIVYRRKRLVKYDKTTK